MSSPISPGDIIALAQGIWKTYKKFADAPAEMTHLGSRVHMVEVLLGHLQTSASHIDFLSHSSGQNLAALLQTHLKSLRKTLRQVRGVGRQWKKAQEKWWRRAPFVLYTMRCVPELLEALDEEIKIISTVREWANQAGVRLGPGALDQIRGIVEDVARKAAAKAKVQAQAKQAKSVAGSSISGGTEEQGAEDDFKTVERKRKAACEALKKTASIRRPTSVAERKTDAEMQLKGVGLPEGEAKILSELYQKEFEKASLGPMSVVSGADSKKKTSVKSVRSFQTGTTKVHVAQPKVQVIKPKKVRKAGVVDTPKGTAKGSSTVVGSVVGAKSQDGKGKKIKKQNGNGKPEETKSDQGTKKQDGKPSAVKTPEGEKKQAATKPEQESKPVNGKNAKPAKPQNTKAEDVKQTDDKKTTEKKENNKKKNNNNKEKVDTAANKEPVQGIAGPADNGKKSDGKNNGDKKNDDKKNQNPVQNKDKPDSKEEAGETDKRKKRKGKDKAADNQPDKTDGQKDVAPASEVSKAISTTQAADAEKSNTGQKKKRKDQAVKVAA